MKLIDLPRRLDAIDNAAERRYYKRMEVKERTDSIRALLTTTTDPREVREHIICLRGKLPWHHLATAGWLDDQLEQLVDLIDAEAVAR